MATVNLGRVKPIYRGNYSAGAVYQPLDFLRYGNLLYICKQQAPAGTLPTNTTYFDVITDEGDVTPGPNRIPKARADGTLDIGWLGGTGLPKARPTLNWDFVNGRYLDPRVSFSRGAPAKYFDAMGVLRTAAENEPRFDYDPVTGECLGLLVEGQATNLLTYSEQFNNAIWSKDGSTVSQNLAVAPDGTLTADKIVEGTGNSTHSVNQVYSGFVSGTLYSFTVRVKSAERTSVGLQLSIGAFGTSVTGTFNLLTETASVHIAGTDTSVRIQRVSSGWYECTLTSRAVNSVPTACFIYVEGSPNVRAYQGDGTSGIYVWGAQLEEGSIPTSYIKTEASQVTRGVGASSVSVDDFPFNQDAFTFVVGWELKGAGPDLSYTPIVKIGGENNATFRGIGFRQNRFTWNVHFSARDDNYNAVIDMFSIPGVQGRNIAAFSFDRGTGLLRASVNGSVVQSDLFPGEFDENFLRRIFLTSAGRLAGAAEPEFYIKRCHYQGLSYYPRALPDAELIALSSM